MDIPHVLSFSPPLPSPPLTSSRGKGDYYRLGHSDDSHCRSPKRVMGPLANRTVVDIACGSLHCVVCTEDGKLFTWGDNDEGQIGNDSTTAMQGPQVLVTTITTVELHLTDTPQQQTPMI